MSVKSSILCLLLCLSCLCEARQEGVTVKLRSCRTEYRTHNSSTTPGFSCTLELVPPPGYKMCESTSLAGIIRVKDAAGSTRLAERGAIIITPDERALTTFTCSVRPTGSKIELEGDLLVTVAKERTAHAPVALNMLGNSEHQLGSSLIKVQPSSANAARNNREGAKLRCAELKLSCSSGATIRRVERVWQGMDGPQLTQPVDIETIGNNSFVMQMWDVNPTEFVRIVTVKAPQREKVHFRLSVKLGEVTHLK